MATMAQIQSLLGALRGIPAKIDQAVGKATNDIGTVNDSQAWSNSFKAEKIQAIRDDATAQIATLAQQAITAREAINSYQPAPIGPQDDLLRESQTSRAWSRAQAMMDGAMSPVDVVRMAVADRDAPMLLAMREEMPARIIMNRSASVTERQEAAASFRAVVDKGITLAFPSSDHAQHWLAVQESNLLAEQSVDAAAWGRVEVIGDNPGGVSGEIHRRTSEYYNNRRMNDLADFKKKLQTASPAELALSSL